MRLVLSTMIWGAALYGVDAFFFKGKYFDNGQKMAVSILQHVR